jgi:hypothetical protein
MTKLNCKGKAVPLQAWSGPEGYRKLRFPDYMTTAQDGGQVVILMHRSPLPPCTENQEQEAKDRYREIFLCE